MPAFSRFLRYFVAVGKSGSIRRAADELNISASAIDRQILNVEADLGMPLFERLPTGLRLTAAGEILMSSAMRWQKNLSDVRSQIEDLRGLKRGHVEIAIIDALAKGYIPAVIHSIQSQYPGISIGIRVLKNDGVRRAIADGEVDFGILFEPQTYRDLVVRAFAEVVLGFVTLNNHPFSDRDDVRFASCIGSKVIVPAPPLAVAEQVGALEGISRVTMDQAARSDNVQMITSLVMQGAGIGILTSIDVLTEVERGILNFTRISDTVLRPMTLALCTAPARTASYAASIALQEIENGFSALGYPAKKTSTLSNS